MDDYLIEVPHSPHECAAADIVTAGAGARIRRSYRGCGDGTHTTWIVAEMATEEEAWSLVPTLLRDTARVTRVDRTSSVATSLKGAKGELDETS